ncbi:MAG: ATP-dependent protease ATPase subunit HslU [Bdellovibrionota bacterium]
MSAAEPEVPVLQKRDDLTPAQIVAELDKYIVGQAAAKRAVAIALRNRWRRQRVPENLREEITPKNILMIGPTGVGKTEIARRLARLASAPFIKVEATKFSEVGYVGKDVESIIRDLAEASVKIIQEEERARVRDKASQMAEERLLDVLLPPAPPVPETSGRVFSAPPPGGGAARLEPAPDTSSTREKLRSMLREGKLSEREVEIDVESRGLPMAQVFTPQGVEEMGIDLSEMMGNLMGGKKKRRKVKVPDALKLLTDQEAERLLDRETIYREAIRRAEESGIVFIDEMDKIAGTQGPKAGPDVSREGVQRDLLPIVEGSTVTTKYGAVRTDHILFVAAGAFHISKPSDLIPELQGRFPIRVELEALGQEDFVRILSEPRNALTRQYAALLEAEGVRLEFTPEGIGELARVATQVNTGTVNIGARRLHTMMEKVLEDVSYRAPEMRGESVRVDAAYVRSRLDGIVRDEDLSRYIL